MARRRIEPPDIGRVTVGANEGPVFIQSNQLTANIQSEPFLVMTFCARRDGNIRLQAFQRCRLRNIDVARRALFHVLLTRMSKPHRLSLGTADMKIWSREFVAALATVPGGFLALPVAIKTGGVTIGRGLEQVRCRHKSVDPTCTRRHRRLCIRGMADFAVVVTQIASLPCCINTA